MNIKLKKYIEALPVEEPNITYLYNGGAYVPLSIITGSLWLASSPSSAAEYALWGTPENGCERTLLVTQPVKTLRLFRLDGNHIEIFYKLYGRAWNHRELSEDLTEIISTSNLSVHGFYRPNSDEFLVVNVDQNLNIVDRLTDGAKIGAIKNT